MPYFFSKGSMWALRLSGPTGPTTATFPSFLAACTSWSPSCCHRSWVAAVEPAGAGVPFSSAAQAARAKSPASRTTAIGQRFMICLLSTPRPGDGSPEGRPLVLVAHVLADAVYDGLQDGDAGGRHRQEAQGLVVGVLGAVPGVAGDEADVPCLHLVALAADDLYAPTGEVVLDGLAMHMVSPGLAVGGRLGDEGVQVVDVEAQHGVDQGGRTVPLDPHADLAAPLLPPDLVLLHDVAVLGPRPVQLLLQLPDLLEELLPPPPYLPEILLALVSHAHTSLYYPLQRLAPAGEHLLFQLHAGGHHLGEAVLPLVGPGGVDGHSGEGWIAFALRHDHGVQGAAGEAPQKLDVPLRVHTGAHGPQHLVQVRHVDVLIHNHGVAVHSNV